MDDGLKQRIIGAFVLIAIIVIFVPVFFDENRLTPLDRTSRIPLQPEMETVEIKPPVEPEIEEPAPIPEESFIPDETKPQTLTEEAPGFTEEGLPKSWALQLASFDDKQRAEAFRDKLLKDGYDAYIREVDTSKGKKNRVYVGPKLDKQALVKEKQKIDKQYKLTAILLKIE